MISENVLVEEGKSSDPGLLCGGRMINVGMGAVEEAVLSARIGVQLTLHLLGNKLTGESLNLL